MVTHTSNIKLQNFDQIFNLEGAEYNVAFEMGWTFWFTSERCISWTFAFSRLKRRMIDFWTLERATLFFHDTNGPQSGRAQCVDFKDNNFYILFTQCLLHWNVSNFRPFCSEVSEINLMDAAKFCHAKSIKTIIVATISLNSY